MLGEKPSQEAMIKSLEIQWQDHSNIRNQTWQALNYSILLFAALVALDFSKQGKLLMETASIAVALFTLLGSVIAYQHIKCQENKLLAIQNLEKALELTGVLKPVIGKKGTYVSTYLALMHFGLFVASLVMVKAVVSR